MRIVVLFLACLALFGADVAKTEKKVESKLRDVARLQGVRGNQLLGYGMVVGLDGTGDKDQTKFTVQSLANLMSRQGLTVNPTTIKVKNVAAVMVTAELPPFARSGSRLDVTVSSTGDAKSLAGGTLLMTAMQGPDGQTYAVAQGPLLVGGFSASAGGASVTKNHPTVGRVPDGGIIEREVGGDFNARPTLRYSLVEEDFTTAIRVVHAINEELGEKLAQPLDARTVELKIPKEFQGRAVELVARLENLNIQLQPKARVVVNERTGTVILGSEVRIGAVSIVQGGLSIVVSSTPLVSQPAPFSQGKTVQATKKDVTAVEEKPKTVTVEPGVSVGKLAEMLNGMGVSPRDMVAILQAIKEAGALQAELRVL
ncbi:MAG: flagellar basal body P-ring protein FlgI [Geothrix sp.]|uniref:flagellar basal body P-ring protein FlgI n=1 Tax=Geothrix sp. TaxID=1962974 RepID=UPI001849BC9B|nr:flagellar basal body P-ring protein FlgI [Geothrix sp.]NWJ40111.1 flagellar basal body P-ring protein FlgI [Geothrix sp.]WIL21880.1 MAG: flagellar basal body P-ring protein FlgI [Geothrix sp.]